MMGKIEQGSQEWHEFRKGGIGSSDIAALMGVCPYKKALQVYNEKSGFCEEKPSTPAMQKGKIYEPEARRKYNTKMQIDYEPICLIHPQMTYVRASLDGYDRATNRVIEIKVPGRKTYDMIADHNAPKHYYMQVQWQLGIVMACNDTFPRADIIAYIPESNEMAYYTIDPDIDLIRDMHAVATQFWDDYLLGIAPT